MNNTQTLPSVRVRLNAFSKDTSGSHSFTIETTSLEDFKNQLTNFDNDVPFSRFYIEHEVLEGDEKLSEIIQNYCDEM